MTPSHGSAGFNSHVSKAVSFVGSSWPYTLLCPSLLTLPAYFSFQPSNAGILSLEGHLFLLLAKTIHCIHSLFWLQFRISNSLLGYLCMVQLSEAWAKCLPGNLSHSHTTCFSSNNGRISLLPPWLYHPSSISLFPSNRWCIECHKLCLCNIHLLSITDHFSYSVPEHFSQAKFLTYMPCNFDTDQELQFHRIMSISAMSNFHAKGSTSNSKCCELSFTAVFPNIIVIWVEYRSDNLLFVFHLM